MTKVTGDAEGTLLNGSLDIYAHMMCVAHKTLIALRIEYEIALLLGVSFALPQLIAAAMPEMAGAAASAAVSEAASDAIAAFLTTVPGSATIFTANTTGAILAGNAAAAITAAGEFGAIMAAGGGGTVAATAAAASAAAIGAGAAGGAAAGGALAAAVASTLSAAAISGLVSEAAKKSKIPLTASDVDNITKIMLAKEQNKGFGGSVLGGILGFRECKIQITCEQGPADYKGQSVVIYYQECKKNDWIFDTIPNKILVTAQ
jgi:hypothetical protein